MEALVEGAYLRADGRVLTPSGEGETKEEIGGAVRLLLRKARRAGGASC